MKKVAILLIVVGVIGMGLTAKPFFSRESLDHDQSFSGDQFDHLVIESNQAAVKILPSTSQNIEVSWKGSIVNRGLGSSDNLVSIEEAGPELRIRVRKPWFFNWSLFNLNFINRLDVTVYLPQKWYRSLVVKNDVGSTVIKDVSVDHLIAENNVSNMTIENVQATSIVAKNDVGNITLTNNQGNLQAESVVGNIAVVTDDIMDDMTLRSDVGKIELTVPFVPDDVTFDAHSSVGAVRIFGEKGSYINRNATYVVSMTTEVGSITVDVGK